MKGRLSSMLWKMVGINAVGGLLVLGLAYGAGARSGGLSIIDAGALGMVPGLELLFAFAIVVFVNLALLLMMGNKFLKPTTEMVDFSDKLVGGDNEARVSLTSDDDFALLAENCNRLAEKLGLAELTLNERNIIDRAMQEITAIAAQSARGNVGVRMPADLSGIAPVIEPFNVLLETISRSVERARAAVNSITSSANQLTMAANQAAATSGQQEQEFTQIAAALEQLSSTGKQIAGNMDDSAAAAQHALQSAEPGVSALQSARSNFDRARASVQTSAQRVRTLGDRTLEVSEMINIIHEVTQQAHVLILNTALEAAAHYQNGGGIAAAAEQARKLFDNTQASTREIVALIKALQSATQESLAALEQGSREIEAGLHASDVALDAMQTLNTATHTAAETHTQVAQASRQQRAVVDRAMSSMEGAAAYARQVSNASRQASRTAEQVVKTAEQLDNILAPFRTGSSTARAELAAAGH